MAINIICTLNNITTSHRCTFHCIPTIINNTSSQWTLFSISFDSFKLITHNFFPPFAPSLGIICILLINIICKITVAQNTRSSRQRTFVGRRRNLHDRVNLTNHCLHFSIPTDPTSLQLCNSGMAPDIHPSIHLFTHYSTQQSLQQCKLPLLQMVFSLSFLSIARTQSQNTFEQINLISAININSKITGDKE